MNHMFLILLYELNGERWIRTTESVANRFTVCPLWPLGNLPIEDFHLLKWDLQGSNL